MTKRQHLETTLASALDKGGYDAVIGVSPENVQHLCGFFIASQRMIRDRLAFYPDKVELYEVDDAVVNPHHLREVDSPVHIDAAIQHTDAGGGAAQGDRWQPNVERPDDSGVR